MKKTKTTQTFNQEENTKPGFTIIEVMLVLGLTGLLLVGLLGGTFSAIKAQRYNDSVRSFAEFLRTTYSEVISPEALGEIGSERLGDKGKAILGKVLVFGENYGDNSSAADANRTVYTATIVGNADLDIISASGSNNASFMEELKNVGAELLCGNSEKDQPSTVSSYLPLWQSELMHINDPAKSWNSQSSPFKGTVIIARSPASGAVHTVYSEQPYDLRNNCQPDNNAASRKFTEDLQNNPNTYQFEEIGFCIKSENSAFMREVRLAKDGRNTSAVSILNVDVTEDENGNEVKSRCQQ